MDGIWLTLSTWSTMYGTKILGAIAILLIGKFAAGKLAGVVRKMMLKANVDETLTRFVGSLTKIGLLTFVIIAAMSTLGIQTASFIAVVGAAGLAVGFALQGSLSNFASGVMLLIFRPFKRGDYVEAAGTAGIVEEIGIFTTFFRSPDNRKVIVPNSSITGGNIINYSAKETRRIDLVFGIGYGDDIREAKKIIDQVISAEPRVLKDPPVTIGVLELGDNSVNLAVRPWVKTPDYWDVYFTLNERIKLTFDEKGITIPYPQRDVHVYNASMEAKTSDFTGKETTI